MSSAIRSQKLRWLGSVLCVGLGFAFGCAGKSESSNGDGSGGDDAGTSGTSGTTSNGGGGATTGGTGSGGKGGCGPSAGSSGKGGGCGVSGTAGSGTGATGGSVTGGSSGDAGATTGGASGSGGAAGEAGTAGTAGMSGAECATAEDCQMVSDCCGCRADPKNAPTGCALDCVRDACADDGIATTEVECVRGRCVIARSCNRAQVTCRAAPPECPEGSLPSVVETCWGPCIAATECSFVTDCLDCGDAACVEFQAQRSSFSCVIPASGCNPGNYCECLGACGYCTEVSQGVTCACPTC